LIARVRLALAVAWPLKDVLPEIESKSGEDAGIEAPADI